VERPAWAPADATHIHEEGDEVYRYNPESPRGYDYRTEKSPEWHKGYTRDRMTSDATLPLAPVAPAPPLAETGHDFTNSRGADLCDLCGQRRHAHAYPALSAPAEPPPAGARVTVDEATGGVKLPGGLVFRLYDDDPSHVAMALNAMLGAAVRTALADAEKRGAEKWVSVSERLPDEDMPVLVAYAHATYCPEIGMLHDGKWFVPAAETELNITHWHDLPPLPAAALAQPVAGADAGGTRGEQVYYKLKLDNACSLPPHQVTIDALNVELKTEYERGYAAAQAEEGESRE
jgi:hypothetical protein